MPTFQWLAPMHSCVAWPCPHRRRLTQELHEEVSISSVELVAEVPEWMTYDFPTEVGAAGKGAAGLEQAQSGGRAMMGVGGLCARAVLQLGWLAHSRVCWLLSNPCYASWAPLACKPPLGNESPTPPHPPPLRCTPGPQPLHGLVGGRSGSLRGWGVAFREPGSWQQRRRRRRRHDAMLMTRG